MFARILKPPSDAKDTSCSLQHPFSLCFLEIEPQILAGYTASWIRRPHSLPYLTAKCGHVTKAWPVRLKQTCETSRLLLKGEETVLLSFALFVAERIEKKNGAPEVFLDYDLTLIIEEICWRQQNRKVHEKGTLNHWWNRRASMPVLGIHTAFMWKGNKISLKQKCCCYVKSNLILTNMLYLL